MIVLGTSENGWNEILDALVGLVHIWDDSDAVFCNSNSNFDENSNFWFRISPNRIQRWKRSFLLSLVILHGSKCFLFCS